MTLAEAMCALETAGTEQNRKIYTRHGVRAAMFGVSFATLDKLQKKIKTDQALAEQLWSTCNHDACILACKIADPAVVNAPTLDVWAKDLDSYVLTDAFAELVAQTPLAEKKIETWTKSKKEWVAAAGWIVLALLARRDAAAPDTKYAAWIPKIEEGLHAAPNRVRYSRNNALIAIGARNAGLSKLAIAAARRIGKVEVDHGQTGCKTPDAEAYILKTLARKA